MYVLYAKKTSRKVYHQCISISSVRFKWMKLKQIAGDHHLRFQITGYLTPSPGSKVTLMKAPQSFPHFCLFVCFFLFIDQEYLYTQHDIYKYLQYLQFKSFLHKSFCFHSSWVPSCFAPLCPCAFVPSFSTFSFMPWVKGWQYPINLHKTHP